MRHKKTKQVSDAHPLIGEKGTVHREAGTVIALGYPATYRVGASSLGAQTVYRVLNQIPGLACTRFFVPDNPPVPSPLLTLENGRPVAEADGIAFSVACETELLEVVRLLEGAQMAPLAADRRDGDPPVIIGGPLTWVDPRLVAPLADVVVPGEAELALPVLGKSLVETVGKRELVARLLETPLGFWMPGRQDGPPELTQTPIELLPAHAATWSPRAELKDLYLLEATRGCKRGCAFCVLSARAGCARTFRAVPMERILGAIPEAATGVGLVGAAVTDHPDIEQLVGRIVEGGRRVSLSSIRADRLTSELVGLLKKGGLRSLTVAADGSSDRLRRSIHKGISSDSLIQASQLGAAHNLSGIKVYSMVGLPGETEDDIREFADLMLTLSRQLKVTVAVQAFVPKPGTPLGEAEMEDLNEIRRRLDLMKRGLKGKVRVMPTSPKWSWIDWKLAHAGERAARVAVAASRLGTDFSAWRRALKEENIA